MMLHLTEEEEEKEEKEKKKKKEKKKLCMSGKTMSKKVQTLWYLPLNVTFWNKDDL